MNSVKTSVLCAPPPILSASGVTLSTILCLFFLFLFSYGFTIYVCILKFFFFLVFHVFEIYINQIIILWVFFGNFFSLTFMFLKFIYIFAFSCNWFLSMAVEYFIIRLYYYVFIMLLIDFGPPSWSSPSGFPLFCYLSQTVLVWTTFTCSLV